MGGKKKYRVGYYVEVEVDAYEGEAAWVADAACGWPGNWSLPRNPVEVSGLTNNGRVKVSAKILTSQALMVKEVFPECERCGYDHLTKDCPYPSESA